MFYAYGMAQIHQFCTRKDQEKKFRVCSILGLVQDVRAELHKAKRDEEYISLDMYEEVKALLGAFGLPYCEAPSEAEAQCAFLVDAKLATCVISDDSDVIVFGGKAGTTQVYRHLFSNHGSPEKYTAKNIYKNLGLVHEDFIALAMMLGCDYTLGVKGIGIVNALEVIHAYTQPPSEEDYAETEEEDDEEEVLEQKILKEGDNNDVIDLEVEEEEVHIEVEVGGATSSSSSAKAVTVAAKATTKKRKKTNIKPKAKASLISEDKNKRRKVKANNNIATAASSSPSSNIMTEEAPPPTVDFSKLSWLDRLTRFKKWSQDVQNFDNRTYYDKTLVPNRLFHKKHCGFRPNWVFPDDFPSPEVWNAFFTPVVDRRRDPFTFGSVDPDEVRRVVGKYMSPITAVDRQLQPVLEKLEELNEKNQRMDYIERMFIQEESIKAEKPIAIVRSNRLRKAIMGLADKKEEDIPADEEQLMKQINNDRYTHKTQCFDGPRAAHQNTVFYAYRMAQIR